MRLDIYLPFMRKAKKGGPPPVDGPWLRLAKRILPAVLFSDRAAAKPGLVRRWLKRLGPTWLSAPVRRASQAACFTLFLVLFFYVCWPYSATPARVWPGMQPSAPNEANQIEVLSTSGDITGLRAGDIVHASHPADSRPTAIAPTDSTTTAGDAAAGYIGALKVLAVGDQQVTLLPTKDFPDEKLEELRFSVGGPWTLSERHPDAWPSHYADELEAKEFLPSESLLVIDPLVAISTTLAAKSWVWSLVCAGGILAVSIFVPRGFCGYICPLGTLIDLFDWAIVGRTQSKRSKARIPDQGWWVHIKYYLLAGTLFCSLFGVLVSGYVAAIPVITRGMLFLFEPMQTAASRGWHNVPPLHAGHWLSIALFFGVLSLGFLKPRFWCKYVCPSGAVFSVGNLFRVSERKVESSCIHCNKCIQICPFDAIKLDFTTRTTDCTLCQTCAGVCPTQSIKFVERWNLVNIKLENDPPTHETPLGRRGFLSLAAGSTAAMVGAVGATAATRLWGAKLDDPDALLPVRPPGSVPEPQFLDLCIRCGECFKACPNNVLQPLGFEQGLEGLWTPAVKADWAGCESSCNACGQVCPTGAIRALPLPEKKVARMGLAIVNSKTCLPHAGVEACQLCVDDCHAAGYDAIEFVRVRTEVDDLGNPVEGSGFLAPSVLATKCVGCGLCQARCYAVNALGKELLTSSAIVVEAGAGKEDRLLSGSYVQLREAEAEERARLQPSQGSDRYLPDFLE